MEELINVLLEKVTQLNENLKEKENLTATILDIIGTAWPQWGEVFKFILDNAEEVRRRFYAEE